MSGVAVAVKEGVLVGAVAVGNGPISASIVPDTAVFVLSTAAWSCNPKAEELWKIRK